MLDVLLNFSTGQLVLFVFANLLYVAISAGIAEAGHDIGYFMITSGFLAIGIAIIGIIIKLG